MSDLRYPALYQINTRVWLTELSQKLGKRATLDDIPDAELDRLAELGFDWVWFLSVWQTGPVAQAISRANAEWRKDFQQTLPDLREEDIAGSGFAIQNYTVHRDLGGAAALARLRQRLQQRRLKLIDGRLHILDRRSQRLRRGARGRRELRLRVGKCRLQRVQSILQRLDVAQSLQGRLQGGQLCASIHGRTR